MSYALLACLLSQFEPLKITDTSVDDYLALCDKQKALAVARIRAEVNSEKASKFRGPAEKARNERIRSLSAQADKLERDKAKIIQPRLKLNKLEPGDIGLIDPPMPDIVLDRPWDGSIDVLVIVDKQTFISRFGEMFFVRGVDTTNLATGRRYKIEGIFVVSSRCLSEGESYYVLEPWKHTTAFETKVKEIQTKAAEDAEKKSAPKKPAKK